MKKGLTLPAICALLGAASLCVRADDAKPQQPPVPSSTTVAAPAMQPTPTMQPVPVAPFDSITSASASSDPESTYLQETDQLNQQRRESAQLSAYDTAQQQSAYDNDWMLRDYTAALKENGLALPTDTDDALVKPPTQPGAPLLQDDPLMPKPQDNQPAPRRRLSENSEDIKPLASSSTLAPLGLKPLLAPLAEAPKPARDPWAFNTSDDADNPLTNNTALMQASVVPNRDNKSSDSLNFLDTPGATAQQDGLIAPANDALLNLQDPLPDENPIHEKPRGNDRTNFLVPTAPTNDVTEFFKKQSEALSPPTAPNAPTPPMAAKPYVPLKDSFPLAKPVANPGMHSRIADPFDILHR